MTRNPDPAVAAATRLVLDLVCTNRGQHEDKVSYLATFRLLDQEGTARLELETPTRVGMVFADIDAAWDDGHGTVTYWCRRCDRRTRITADAVIKIASAMAAETAHGGRTSFDLSWYG